MKKIIVFVFMPFALMAGSDKKLFIGLNASPHIAWQTGFKSIDISQSGRPSNLSYALGLYSEYSITHWLYLATGISYSYQKTNLSYFYSSALYKQTYTCSSILEYLKIPFQVKFLLKVSPNIDIYYTTGLYYSYLIHSSENGDKLNRTFYNYDLGGTLGNGVNIRLSSKIYLDLGARIDYSFTDIEKTPITGYSATHEIQTKNLLFGLFLGIKYNILR